MISVIRPYANLRSDGAGNDRYVNLCLQLQRRGIDTRLVCSNFVHNKKVRRTSAQMQANKAALPFVVEIESAGYTRNMSVRRVLYELIFGFRALHWVARNRPQSILVGEPLFFVGWLFVLYGILFDVPVSADVIDVWPEADTRRLAGLGGTSVKMLYGALKWSRRLRLALYSRVAFVSISYASMFHLKSKSSVFYWGSELMPRPDVVRREGDVLTIVYAGSFGEGYDIQTVLEAARLLAAHASRRFRVVLAGGGGQQALVRAAAQGGYVDYLGYIDKEELVDLYMKTDIGVLPYKADSMVAMPIKFFDYVNFGIFAISSLALEVSDVIKANGIGLSYKAGNARDLFEKIIEASEDVGRRVRVNAACAQLREYYSVARQYGKFADFVAEATGSSPR